MGFVLIINVACYLFGSYRLSWPHKLPSLICVQIFFFTISLCCTISTLTLEFLQYFDASLTHRRIQSALFL